MFTAPPIFETKIFATIPDALRVTNGTSSWMDRQLRGRVVDCFLEGPAFDRKGNLYCVDIPFGRIFRFSPSSVCELFVEYDGEPNGLKIHRDGRIFIADHRHGILVLDPETRNVAVGLTRPFFEGFKGPNDLFFGTNGDLYFTDQGQSGLQDPSGRVFVWQNNGNLQTTLSNIPSPNGLVLVESANGRTLLVTVTRDNSIWRIPLSDSGEPPTKVGVFIQLSGGIGPDGIVLDDAGNIFVAHPGLGTVWMFDQDGEPRARICTCEGKHPTNLAFGGDEAKTLFITEADTGTIQTVDLQTRGRPLYSHA